MPITIASRYMLILATLYATDSHGIKTVKAVVVANTKQQVHFRLKLQPIQHPQDYSIHQKVGVGIH